VAFAGYLALQLAVVAGMRTPRFHDSASDLKLSFRGREPRLWTVPLVYRLLPTDDLRIAGQTVIAALAWWALAMTAGSLVVDRRVRTALMAVILALGLVGPVSNWNSTILSESLSLSLTALLVAAWLRYAWRPTTVTAALAVGVTVLWTFTRQTHVIVGLFVTVFAVAATLHRRSALRVVVAASLIVLSVLGLASLTQNRSVADQNIAYRPTHRRRSRSEVRNGLRPALLLSSVDPSFPPFTESPAAHLLPTPAAASVQDGDPVSPEDGSMEGWTAT